MSMCNKFNPHSTIYQLLHNCFLWRKKEITKEQKAPDDPLKKDNANIDTVKTSTTNVVNRTVESNSDEAKTSLKKTKGGAYNPRQPSPRLCRVLKFDCKNRPDHLCCAHFSSTIEVEETEDRISHTQLEQNFTKENDNSHKKAAQERKEIGGSLPHFKHFCFLSGTLSLSLKFEVVFHWRSF